MSGPECQVVVSFRVNPDPELDPPAEVAQDLRRELRLWGEEYGGPLDLDVAVREIGAGGESSVDEGRWDANERSGNAV